MRCNLHVVVVTAMAAGFAKELKALQVLQDKMCDSELQCMHRIHHWHSLAEHLSSTQP